MPQPTTHPDPAAEKHTAGRLKVMPGQDNDSEYEVAMCVDERDNCYLLADEKVPFSSGPANARRLAAAWNAMQRVSADELALLNPDDVFLALVRAGLLRFHQPHVPQL